MTANVQDNHPAVATELRPSLLERLFDGWGRVLLTSLGIVLMVGALYTVGTLGTTSLDARAPGAPGAAPQASAVTKQHKPRVAALADHADTHQADLMAARNPHR